MEIEIRSWKIDKKSWPFGDALEEIAYDARWVVPLWKWRIVRFLLGKPY